MRSGDLRWRADDTRHPDTGRDDPRASPRRVQPGGDLPSLSAPPARRDRGRSRLGRAEPRTQLAGGKSRGVIDPLPIDECLSPDLVALALARGLCALHVVWLNRDGADDRDLAALGAERDYVFVTNNRRDSCGFTPGSRYTTA